MPYHLLLKAKRGRDVTNRKHLYAIADELGVTKSNLLYRLKSLNWIYQENGSKQIYPGKYLPK